MMRLVLSREDIQNHLHPRMWEDICDSLNLGPDEPHGRYPDVIELKVVSAQPLLID